MLDENGEAVIRRIVSLHARSDSPGEDGEPTWERLPGPATGKWRTDANGAYRLHGIPSNRALAVSVEGGGAPVEFLPPALGLDLLATPNP